MIDAKQEIRDEAIALGFDAVGFASAEGLQEVEENLFRFLDLGFHGDMAWMQSRAAQRGRPRALWPSARSVIVVALNYAPDEPALAMLERPEIANLSVYARNRDYHDVLKKRLKALGRWLQQRFGGELKVFVDTAPVMEKPLAQQAGLGWQGKHTNLVSREFGSWLFLGVMFTTLDLEPDPADDDHCGSCRQCLDICPTAAFTAPYQLDARRCISYLTIEHKGHIAPEFRGAIGNRVYGCDDCLAVCPWNKYAKASREAAFIPRPDLTAARLEDLARLDDTAFRKRFAGSPIKRVGRDRFLRNVLIAIGNSGEAAALPVIHARLDDESPLVRAMAVWALKQLVPPGEFETIKARRLALENDPDVRREWRDSEEVSQGAIKAPSP